MGKANPKGEVFDRNALGMFVAQWLTNLQDDEALTLTLSRVDELLLAAKERPVERGGGARLGEAETDAFRHPARPADAPSGEFGR
jgi:hypothetical protein